MGHAQNSWIFSGCDSWLHLFIEKQIVTSYGGFKPILEWSAKKFPSPENYIIQHTHYRYVPLIVERLEYLKLATGANVKLPGSNNGPLDLNSISRQVINDKGIMKLFSMIIKGKIKQISEKNIDGTK